MKYFMYLSNVWMNELRVAYIRPTGRATEAHQRALVSTYDPATIETPDTMTLDDLCQLLARPGRVLIVPRLAAIHRQQREIARVVHSVLSAGATIIEAQHDRIIPPEHMDAVMAGLEAPRQSVSKRKKPKKDNRGGPRPKFTPEQMEQTRAVWQSAELTHANARELTAHIVEGGVSYSTMWRWWTNRPIPVERPVQAGRR